MAANKQMSFVAGLTTTLTTNIMNGAVTSMAGPVGITIAQPVLYIKEITISNKTASAATFSLWIGASAGNAANTEFLGTGYSIAANANYQKFFGGNGRRLDAADFLVGGSNTASALTLQAVIEVGISG